MSESLGEQEFGPLIPTKEDMAKLEEAFLSALSRSGKGSPEVISALDLWIAAKFVQVSESLEGSLAELGRVRLNIALGILLYKNLCLEESEESLKSAWRILNEQKQRCEEGDPLLHEIDDYENDIDHYLQLIEQSRKGTQ